MLNSIKRNRTQPIPINPPLMFEESNFTFHSTLAMMAVSPLRIFLDMWSEQLRFLRGFVRGRPTGGVSYHLLFSWSRLISRKYMGGTLSHPFEYPFSLMPSAKSFSFLSFCLCVINTCMRHVWQVEGSEDVRFALLYFVSEKKHPFRIVELDRLMNRTFKFWCLFANNIFFLFVFTWSAFTLNYQRL